MMIGSSNETVRVDLHLHSRASGSATNVWVKGLGDERGVRESYTLPEESYRMAKRAGMDFVTLTDHETIGGPSHSCTTPTSWSARRFRPDFLKTEATPTSCSTVSTPALTSRSRTGAVISTIWSSI